MEAELKKLWADFKTHPYVGAGIIFVLGVALILLFRSGSGSSNAASPAAGTATTANASEAAALQSEELEAQLAAEQSQQSSAATAANDQIAGAENIAQIQAGTTMDAIGVEGSVASQSIAATQSIDLASIAANYGLGTVTSNNATAVQLASIGAVVNIDSIQSATQLGQDADVFDYLQNSLVDQYGYMTADLNDQYSIEAEVLSSPAPAVVNTPLPQSVPVATSPAPAATPAASTGGYAAQQATEDEQLLLESSGGSGGS